MQDKKKERAAYLIAEDRFTDQQIADELAIDPATLWRWKKRPAFVARVAEIVQAFADKMVAEGIANKQNRIDALEDRHKRMEKVIDERSSDPRMRRAAGGETGLLTVTYKGKDADREEFVVDTGLLAEMRATEKQAAIELGQWTEKKDVTSGGKSIDEALNAILDRVVRFVVPDEQNPFPDGG